MTQNSKTVFKNLEIKTNHEHVILHFITFRTFILFPSIKRIAVIYIYMFLVEN